MALRTAAEAVRTEEITMQYMARKVVQVIESNGLAGMASGVPHCRVKLIMKQELEACNNGIRRIATAAVPLMSFACALFIGHVTAVAWANAARKRRKTLLLTDLREALLSSDKFDYLIDMLDDFDARKRLGTLEEDGSGDGAPTPEAQSTAMSSMLSKYSTPRLSPVFMDEEELIRFVASLKDNASATCLQTSMGAG